MVAVVDTIRTGEGISSSNHRHHHSAAHRHRPTLATDRISFTLLRVDCHHHSSNKRHPNQAFCIPVPCPERKMADGRRIPIFRGHRRPEAFRDLPAIEKLTDTALQTKLIINTPFIHHFIQYLFRFPDCNLLRFF